MRFVICTWNYLVSISSATPRNHLMIKPPKFNTKQSVNAMLEGSECLLYNQTDVYFFISLASFLSFFSREKILLKSSLKSPDVQKGKKMNPDY